MTVNTAASTATYTGNGSTTVFPVPFYFLVNTDLQVLQKVAATGVIKTLVLNSDYTLTGAGVGAGGSLTMTVAPAIGDTLYIARNVAAVQQTAYPSNSPFPASSHEMALDRLTMLAQQQAAAQGLALARSPLSPIYDLQGNTLINEAVAVNPSDVPNLQQVQALTAAGSQAVLNTPSGASLVGVSQAGAGAVALTVQDVLRETVSVKRFGAKGDGVTDDTAAFTACLSYCQTAGKAMLVPDGTYLVDEINYGHPAGALKSPPIYGSGKQTTILNKKTADGNPVIAVNSASSGGYTTVDIRDLTINGIAGNTPAGILATACVWSNFTNIDANNCVYGFSDLGGISNTYTRCKAVTCQRNFNFDIAPAPSNSVPNNCTLFRCISGSATDIGIYFDHGAMLTIDCCDVEGNGTALGAGAGAVVVGANVPAGTPGVTIKNTWFEQNSVHVLWFKSGTNTVRNCLIVANAGATNDVNADGGNYVLDTVTFATVKTANVLEGASITTGNAILNCTLPAYSINTAKTLLLGGNKLLMRSGEAPIVYGVSSPLLQSGTVTCNASGVGSVAFPKAYAVAPNVVCSVSGSNNPAIVVSTQVNGLGTSGFNVQTSYATGSAVATSALLVQWIAVGQGT